jgi:hypothetical protein
MMKYTKERSAQANGEQRFLSGREEERKRRVGEPASRPELCS